MHRSQSAETRGSKGMSPLNRRFAPPIRGCWPSQRIRISNLCPILFLDSDYLDRLLEKEGIGLSVIRARRASPAGRALIVVSMPKCFLVPDQPVHSFEASPY